MAFDSELTLFGLDLRKIPQFWLAGLQELLWAPNAYCRRWFDEVVTTRMAGSDSKQCYQAGEKVSSRKTKIKAYILPEELVLETSMDLPASVDLDLESMVLLEVRAKSPFPEEDTRYGWQFERRENDRLKVDLVIASQNLITQHLWDAPHTLDDGEEVWAMVDKQPIVIRGFGEKVRDSAYRHRMKWVITGLFYSFLMLCALIGVMMLFKYWQVEQIELDHERIQQESLEAVELRTKLTEHNVTVGGINSLIARSYNPYSQISKLSEILEDDAWLVAMDIKEKVMRISGRSENAAALMQTLSNRPEFSEVVAPSAISRARRGGGEQFVFDLTLEPSKVEPAVLQIQESTLNPEAKKEVVMEEAVADET